MTSNDPQILCKWLTLFIAEVRKKDGSPYPHKTVYRLLTGLLRHMRSVNVECPNFLDTNDSRFATFHNGLDNVLRELCGKGIGAQTQRTEAFTKADEESLWQSGVLGIDNPKSLLYTVFLYERQKFLPSGR